MQVSQREQTVSLPNLGQPKNATAAAAEEEECNYGKEREGAEEKVRIVVNQFGRPGWLVGVKSVRILNYVVFI